MCGITAMLRQDRRVQHSEIQSMNDALSHRGPDGDGVWLHENVGLGHRRLSIIDPSTGAQPMSNAAETIWITFNGEIYNYKELRQELSAKGYVFRTKSDTESILYAYEEWGKDCVNKLRGMFAFCITDLRKKELFLARDHFGIKPLFYMNWSGCFAIASELQSLKTIDVFPHALSLSAIDQYLWLQYIPAPNTIYKRVHKLPPAHRMTVQFNGETSGPELYWDSMFEPDTSRTEAQWLEELESVLQESVQAHLVSDVPFGAYLSGGVDSTTIVKYMTEALDTPVHTFSIGFEEQDFNELPYAALVAEQEKTVSCTEIVRPDALSILPDLVRHYGEPFGDSSAIPTYYVSKLARKHVPMVLSGDGGDEAFGGYNTYGSWMDSPKHQTLEGWLSLMQYYSRDWRKALWRDEYSHVMQDRLDVFEDAYSKGANFGTVQRVQYVDRKTYLPNAILQKVDIASMMHGLEVRTPFLDVRLWETVRRIPEDFNMHKMDNGQWEGKMLLKTLLSRSYSKDFVHRKKTGFGVPLEVWFAEKDMLGTTLREKLLNRSSHLQEYFNPEAIERVIKNAVPGPIWLLLFLDEWLNQCNESLV